MTDTAQDSNDSTQAAKPKRNPTERILVWGVILVGVIIACTEGTARFGYSMSLNALQDRVREDDAGEDSKPLMIADAENLMVGFPKKEAGNQRVTYRFKGFVKEFGAIHLNHDDEGLVLGLETDAPPEVEEPKYAGGTDEEDGVVEEGSGSPSTDNSGGPGMGPGGGRGSGGGGRNFDPMQFDENKDGKISLEEAPERMKESFSETDTNGDGFIDTEEFAARRAARQQQREARANEGERPQRPEVEESETKEPAEEATEPVGSADETE